MKKLILLQLYSKFKGFSSSTKRKIFIGLGLFCFFGIFVICILFYGLYSLSSKAISQVKNTNIIGTMQMKSETAWMTINNNINQPACRKQIDELFMLSTWLNLQPVSRWDDLQKNCFNSIDSNEISTSPNSDF